MQPIKHRLPSLSADDAAAILAALPLVNLACAAKAESMLRNELFVASTTQKLLHPQPTMDTNEVRVIFLAIAFAREYISGNGDGLLDTSAISPQRKSQLAKHFFTYNRLYPSFLQIVEAIDA